MLRAEEKGRDSDLTHVAELLAEGQKNVSRLRAGPKAKASDLSWVRHYDTWFVNWHSVEGFDFLRELDRVGNDASAPWNAYSSHSEYPKDVIENARAKNLRIWNDLPIWERILWSTGLNVTSARNVLWK